MSETRPSGFDPWVLSGGASVIAVCGNVSWHSLGAEGSGVRLREAEMRGLAVTGLVTLLEQREDGEWAM